MSTGLRKLFRRSTDKVDELDDRLPYMDQATFLSNTASGRVQVMHAIWFYEKPVDYDGLHKFHENFSHTMAARRIERSPLPFGRHRWVLPEDSAVPLDVAENTRPRSELGDWFEERTHTPIDPVNGPSWHIAVQPFSDGSTGISIMVSHCVIDGAGGVMSALEAMMGHRREHLYDPPGSRTKWRAIRSDLRQARRDLPETGKALVNAAKMAYRHHNAVAENRNQRPPVAPHSGSDEYVRVPFATAIFNAAEWDARAEALNGNSYSLVAGFAAELGRRMGRSRSSDGKVSLMVVINDRLTLDDTRANAMLFTNIVVDPHGVTTDLTEMRSNIRGALKSIKDAPDESFALLPLTPFIPKRAVNRTADLVFGDVPVTCSNFGEIPTMVGCVDGATNATFVTAAGADQNMRKADLDRTGGMLIVASARYDGQLILGVIGYRTGADNRRAALRELLDETAAEFGLTPTMTF
ncbi:hypothetical protein ABIA30_000787 [Mycobacterium sp. MAA66]|uniref:hypothetical protein n=1 Tax=Mycobacterium sp. MAA66 TaxID=3156297 RepID=UPI003515820F